MPALFKQPLSTLIGKELRSAYRDKTVVLLFTITWSLFVVSGMLTAYQYHHDVQERIFSNEKFRKQWDAHQGNPHEAAHFGTYIFKPLNILNAFDSGLNDYFGTTFRVEAHVQHEVDYSNAESKDALMRFGQFSFALILQLLVPLLILFTVSSSITAEKESGTLKMLFAQGIKPAALAWGKVWSGFLMIALLIIPFFIILLIMIVSTQSGLALTVRFLIISISYLLYYFLITVLGVIVSIWSKNSGTAILSVLIIWLLTSIIIPKAATGIAGQRYPLMSRATFNDSVKQSYLKGINGNDPYYDRTERYLKELLLKYKVDTASQLPVDANGVILQYNEDYQNMVFNHYHSRIENTFQQQQNFLSYIGILDPFISMKRISMSMASTDFYHHNDFFLQAQRYRNSLIRRLNLELANHPQKDGQEYKAGPDFFKQIKDFKYQLPATTTVLKLQLIGILALISWIILLSIILQFISSRLIL